LETHLSKLFWKSPGIYAFHSSVLLKPDVDILKKIFKLSVAARPHKVKFLLKSKHLTIPLPQVAVLIPELSGNWPIQG
jgi:hypothetical protein